MVFRVQSFFFIVFFLLSFSLRAAENIHIPLNGLKIRLVPKTVEPVGDLGVKTITVSADGNTVKIDWFSTVRLSKKTKPWPEYKVAMKRGVIQWPAHSLKTFWLHPHFWSSGFSSLEEGNPLWVPAELLNPAIAKKDVFFDLVFLNPFIENFGKIDSGLFQKVNEFRTLVGLVLSPDNPEAATNLPLKDKRKLEAFIHDLRHIHFLEGNKNEPLIVNGNQAKVPAVLVGNKYVVLTVLNNASTPLILNIEFNPAEVPSAFKGIFHFFKDYFEFQVTQVQY